MNDRVSSMAQLSRWTDTMASQSKPSASNISSSKAIPSNAPPPVSKSVPDEDYEDDEFEDYEEDFEDEPSSPSPVKKPMQTQHTGYQRPIVPPPKLDLRSTVTIDNRASNVAEVKK
jgi:hypothetical protein